MAVPVVYRQAARREIVDVARTYEGQRQGIGRIEAHISDGPRLYQLVVGGVRRAVLRRFPYGLFYLDEEQRIVVVACLDLRRDPQTITSTIATRRTR